MQWDRITGAIISTTDDYVLPGQAERRKDYICPACRNECILKKGPVIRAHFAHKAKQGCSFYTRCGESEIHKHCKYVLQQHLKDKGIIDVSYACRGCKKNIDITSVQLSDDGAAVLERQLPGTRYMADVACVDNVGKIEVILEVYHSNKTKEDRREGYEWYEFHTTEIIERFVEDDDLNLYMTERNGRSCLDLTCHRSRDMCDDCEEREERARIRHEEWQERQRIESEERARQQELERQQRVADEAKQRFEQWKECARIRREAWQERQRVNAEEKARQRKLEEEDTQERLRKAERQQRVADEIQWKVDHIASRKRELEREAKQRFEQWKPSGLLRGLNSIFTAEELRNWNPDPIAEIVQRLDPKDSEEVKLHLIRAAGVSIIKKTNKLGVRSYVMGE